MGRHAEVLLTLQLFLLLIGPVVSQTGCESPPTSYSTNHSGGTTTTFLMGANITYTCTLGFSPVGSTVRTCQANRTWTGSDDVCRIDALSLVLACCAGLAAILIFIVVSCWLITRKSRAKRRGERRLTIQRENERRVAEAAIDGPAAAADGLADEEDRYTVTTPSKHRVDRNDSGLQTDLDLEEIDLNDFNIPANDEPLESPTSNNYVTTTF